MDDKNLEMILPFLERVEWDEQMAQLGEKMYRFNCRMFDPAFVPPKNYRQTILYFLLNLQDRIPFEDYSIHYLRSLTPKIKTTDDLNNWIDMVNQFPPGTPLRSRRYGLFETFMGVCFYTNPLPPNHSLLVS